jgi:hypothetical protein
MYVGLYVVINLGLKTTMQQSKMIMITFIKVI